MSDKIDKYYLKKAEEVVDALFDKGYFKEDVSRKEMTKVEELIGYIIQSESESAVKMHEMIRKTT
jgi:hypothetical protein